MSAKFKDSELYSILKPENGELVEEIHKKTLHFFNNTDKPKEEVNLVDDDGSTFLHLIASYPVDEQDPFIPIIYQLGTEGIVIDAKDDQGNTALHKLAEKNGSWRAIQALIRLGANMEIPNKEGKFPFDIFTDDGIKSQFDMYTPGLWGAVENSDVIAVQRLLGSWCFLHERGVDNHTMDIVEYAKTKGNADIVAMLDKAKPTLSLVKPTLACDEVGMTKAMDDSGFEMDYNTMDQLFKTELSDKPVPLPLIIETSNNIQDLDIVRVLMQTKADVNYYHDNMFPRGPVYFMLETVYPKSPEDIALRVLEEADFTLKNSKGQTYLYDINADVRSSSFIEQVIRKGADICERDEQGNSVIEHNVLLDQKEGVAFFKQYLLDVITGDDWERRRNFIVPGLDLILEATDENETPVRDIAKQNNDTRTTEFLQELEKIKRSHVDLTYSIMEGIENTTVDIEHVLSESVDKDQLVLIQDKGGRNSLHMACLINKVFLVEFLINNYTDTINRRDNLRRTPLHYVAALDNEILYTTLVKAGADETLKDVNNLTPKDYLNMMQKPPKPEEERQPGEFLVQDMIKKEEALHYGFQYYYQFSYNKFVKAITNKNLKSVQVTTWKFDKDLNNMTQYIATEPLLFLCLKHKTIDIAKFFIDKGLDPYVTWEGVNFRDATRESGIQELVECIEEAIRIKTLQDAAKDDRRSSASSYRSLPYEPPMYRPRTRKRFTDTPNNIDSRYLADQVGEALQIALAEVADKRPWDPIEYLAHWLYKHADNLRKDEEERKETYQLELEKYEAHREKRREKRRTKEVESIKLADAERMKKQRIEEEKKKREKAEEEKRLAELEEIQKKNRENVEQYAQKPDLDPVMEEEEPASKNEKKKKIPGKDYR